jgi:hypothetical protein
MNDVNARRERLAQEIVKLRRTSSIYEEVT